jgi:hypothetical protein
MDLAGGVCSYTAYDIIRSVVLAVDKNNVNKNDESANAKRTGLCLMPSSSELRQAAKYAEKVGQTITVETREIVAIVPVHCIFETNHPFPIQLTLGV